MKFCANSEYFDKNHIKCKIDGSVRKKGTCNLNTKYECRNYREPLINKLKRKLRGY